MKTGILLLNFGEPERAEPDDVVAFLEAIFMANFQLEHAADPESGRQRARELAERRAPAILEDYRTMGGSPLRRQTESQAQALEIEIRQREANAVVAVGMQFASPYIRDSITGMRDAGVDQLVGLPLYPLCGPSTTMFALREMQRAIEDVGWDIDVEEITGWHTHPEYMRMRARAVRSLCEREQVNLSDPGTRLVFSAHGTPVRYLEEGSRYDLYVQDHCAALAVELGVENSAVGYQNHANRPNVEWTQPETTEVLRDLEADDVVVVPVSFMQEQSETLIELDVDLRNTAESFGMRFHRVPVPFDDPTFASILADLVEDAQSMRAECRCRPGAFCLNHRFAYESRVGVRPST